jgi:hypothetical protein
MLHCRRGKVWRHLNDKGRPTIPPEYHKPTDTPEGLDYDGAVVTGCCILGGIYHLTGTGGA